MMQHIKEILKKDKFLSDVYRSWLEQDLEFYRGVLLRHKDNKEISELCTSICKRLMEEIESCHAWDVNAEKIEVSEYIKNAVCNN